MERILRLDVPASLKLLEDVFPQRPDPTVGLDFGEPSGPREAGTYEALHRDREVSGAIQHEVGSFG